MSRAAKYYHNYTLYNTIRLYYLLLQCKTPTTKHHITHSFHLISKPHVAENALLSKPSGDGKQEEEENGLPTTVSSLQVAACHAFQPNCMNLTDEDWSL